MSYADTIGLAGLVVLIVNLVVLFANLVVFYFVLRETRRQSATAQANLVLAHRAYLNPDIEDYRIVDAGTSKVLFFKIKNYGGRPGRIRRIDYRVTEDKNDKTRPTAFKLSTDVFPGTDGFERDVTFGQGPNKVSGRILGRIEYSDGFNKRFRYFCWYVRRINQPLGWKIDILEGQWNNETDGNEELDAKWKEFSSTSESADGAQRGS